MIYVTSLIRYKPFGYLYQVDPRSKSIVNKVRVHSDQSVAKHGGPNGLAVLGDFLVTGTYSDIRFYDSHLQEVRRFTHPYLSGVHGLSVSNDRIWVSSCNNEAVLCFTPNGELQEEIFLEEDPDLMQMVGSPPVHIDRERDFRNERRPYERQPFHVNHVQEREEGLYLSLHKQGVLYEYRSKRPICSVDSHEIHDAQRNGNAIFVNDTEHNQVKILSHQGHPKAAIPVDVHRFLSCLAETSVKCHYLVHSVKNTLSRIPFLGSLFRPHKCHTNWLRGLKVTGRDLILVGGSPSAIFGICIRNEEITWCLPLSWNPCEAVFGIETLNHDDH